MTTTAVPTTWQMDTVHSSAAFAVKHMVVSTFRAKFDDVAATLDLSGDEPALTGRVAVASIDVKDDNLRAHLLSQDFFDAANAPEIVFVSTKVERGSGDDVAVEGELTIKGVTKTVSATGTITEPTEDPFGSTRVCVTLETVVDRTQFGLDWNQPLPKGGFALADDVTLHVELEFVGA
jgi:polyisoprenoid-binding protein YceI